MTIQPQSYDWLYHTPTGRHWERICARRRAGVAVPLFSLFSGNSIGSGEIPDLRLLIDWCGKTGLSIIQLLPLNDVGFSFTPYDAKSSFALDPLYLSLYHLAGIDFAPWQKEIEELRKRFPGGQKRVDYAVKGAKLELLWKLFLSGDWSRCSDFAQYQERNIFWLEDYARFKVCKERQGETAWWEWPEELRLQGMVFPDHIIAGHQRQIEFQKWLQWQLFQQMQNIKAYAKKNDVLLLGDLPFLVSRDSADVWARQSYFKLHLAAGAPPDMYYANGQRWGMPPYDWEAMAGGQYDYLIQKLKYSENFYDLYRIDHFIGVFRIWTIPLAEPGDNAGKNGVFDPPAEDQWEQHGRKLLDVMIQNTIMLPCAEDLGTVPDCSYTVVKDHGIVGMDVQRWQRDWGKTNDFKTSEEYRQNAIATVSTHDTFDLRGWWEFEVNTVDEMGLRNKCRTHGLDSEVIIDRLIDRKHSLEGRLRWKKEIQSQEQVLAVLERDADKVNDIINMFRETVDERKKFLAHLKWRKTAAGKMSRVLAKKILAKINEAVSIFSIHLLQDWLSFTHLFDSLDPRQARINRPGTNSADNWSVVMPLSLEALLELKENEDIKEICRKSGRIHYAEDDAC
ncbi:4-alpha-glucanotransferase [candidate division FCPU426 bacterium]|nr:4-alpha-glucanotransferase [candidate division FCPU426 bacterium]